MAGIDRTHETLTHRQIMELPDTEAQRLRAVWAIHAEEKKRRHKEALEHARRTSINEKKDDSNA